MAVSLSVVIPAYNEEENVASCIRHVYQVLKESPWDWEIIIVNDGSKDKTGLSARSEIKKLKIKSARVLEHFPNRGYGGSLKRGFYDARKEFVVFVPADNQFDFSQVADLVQRQQATSADIVSGVRPYGGRDPFHRLFFRWGWNTLVRALFGYLATDVDCGFKLFRRSLLDRISLPSDGAMIDTQLFAGTRARGFKITEIPVTHLPRTAGKSTGGHPKVIFKALKELFVFWWQLRQEILVEQGRAVFRWEAIAFLSLLLLAAFLRLYKIDQYMTFLGDEGRDALAMRDIIIGAHYPAIGPGTSIGNMYLGPLYYYLAAPSLALTNFSPVGPAMFVAGIGLLTVSLIWWIGRQWFGRLPALIVSSLYALSPTVITYSNSSWNPNIMPFFSLLTVYGIWKVWRLGYWRWLVISALSFAVVLNSHYLGLLLAPTLLIFWLAAFFQPSANRRAALWATGISVLLWLLLMSPLAVYDIRHSGQNFAAVKTFFTQRQATVNLKAYKALPRLWPVWQDVTVSLLAARQKLPGQKIALFLAASTTLVLFSRGNMDLKFTLTWLLVGLIGLGLYKQHVYDHYFGFIFPAPFLLLGFTVQFLGRNRMFQVIALVLLLWLLSLSLRHLPLRYPPHNQLAHAREISDFITRQATGNPFNLALLARSNYDASYRYFLKVSGSPHFTIHERLASQLFVICEIPDCQPLGHPLWEIAAFGWAKIDNQWSFPWGVKLYRLVPNPAGS